MSEGGAVVEHFDEPQQHGPVITQHQGQNDFDLDQHMKDAHVGPAAQVDFSLPGLDCFVLKELVYSTLLPNIPEKMKVAEQITSGLQHVARATPTWKYFHAAFSRDGKADGIAFTAHLGKTKVLPVIEEDTPDFISIKWCLYFKPTGGVPVQKERLDEYKELIRDDDAHAGIDAIRQLAKHIHMASQDAKSAPAE
eukprot:m.563837 g.563837  ORF g.563837 m.563837 type:complete len:195 (-) comp22235_c4_seq11:2646-3230(-)